MKAAEDREFVQSLERGLSVLKVFRAEAPRMTLSEIASVIDLNRATTRRFLLTLVRLKLVGTDGKYFWLTPGVLDLGYRYLSSLPWWDSAQPIIDAISNDVGETCSIAVLDGSEIVYVARASIRRVLATNISVGSRFPALYTAMGRCIVSGMPEDQLTSYLAQTTLNAHTSKSLTDPDQMRTEIETCRRQGYSVCDGEYQDVLRGLAVPVRDSTGRIVAALGISVHVAVETPQELLKRGLTSILEGAARISQSMALRHS